MTDEGPPRSLWSRSWEMLHLGARLGSQHLTEKFRDGPGRRVQAQVGQARILVKSLGRLKGAAMKVGQMLSLEARDFLPPEAIEVLSQLQNQSEDRLSFDQVKRLLRDELGPERLAQLHDLSPEPVAAASIGQVHRAQVRGRAVAIKVQYPGVAEAIDSDLLLLKGLAKSFLSLSRRPLSLDPLFTELRDVLKSEVDYRQEAAHLERYRDTVATSPHFCVPELFPDFSTARVLTLSWEDGKPLETWLASQPPLEAREHFGRQLLELYTQEFFHQGFVQSDPNFANFSFRPEQKQIVLFDFGAMRSYSEDFRREYSRLLHRVHEKRPAEALDQATGMGFIDERESDETKTAFLEMLNMSLLPFEEDRQPFYFGDRDYAWHVRRATRDFVQQVRFTPPPHELIFLHRKLGGVFHLLKALDVSIDLRPFWQQLQTAT